MKIRIEINCDNAAFGDTEEEQVLEASRIIEVSFSRLCRGEVEFPLELFDVNGNHVGFIEFVE